CWQFTLQFDVTETSRTRRHLHCRIPRDCNRDFFAARIMKPVLALILILAAFVPLKLKMEVACDRIVPGALSIDLREQIGQSAFIAVLGGFFSSLAVLLFIHAYSDSEPPDS